MAPTIISGSSFLSFLLLRKKIGKAFRSTYNCFASCAAWIGNRLPRRLDEDPEVRVNPDQNEENQEERSPLRDSGDTGVTNENLHNVAF